MNCQDHLYRNADPRKSVGAGSSSNVGSAWAWQRWPSFSKTKDTRRRPRIPRASIRLR